MTKLSPGAHDRLLNLLYKKTVPEIKTKIPIVKRVLYDPDTATDPQKSVLDELMEYQWDQRPMEEAVADVAKAQLSSPRSNILRLDCRNAFVGRTDLHNIFPINRERLYSLPQPLRKGLDFHVVKARNPYTLLFTGAYYLVFPNYNQACVYYLETKNKMINGLPLDLQFVSPTETHLCKMGSPLLHADPDMVPSHYLPSFLANTADAFAKSEEQLQIIRKLQDLDLDRSSHMGTEKDPLYDLLAYFMDVPSRYSTVLVKNLPFGISKPALHNLLWNYEFQTLENPQKSIIRLYADPVKQVSVTLMKFRDERNAQRLVRNYHGRRWEKMLSRKEKALYEPLLCEIVD